MRTLTAAKIGKGKAVHVFYPNFGRTDCATGGMSDADATIVDEAVTCKRCLKALAVTVERAHTLALDMNAEIDAATWTPELDETPAAPVSRKQRRAARRALAATLREQAPQMRSAARARRSMHKTAPQPARDLLVAAGLPDALAKRYVSAFSNNAECTAKTTKRIRKGPHRSERVEVKLYSRQCFNARLAEYRPKNADHALLFEFLAA